MTTTPAAGQSASAWALHQLLDLISRRVVDAGDRLPPERELAASLGVSRSSVREAISALVTLGVLEARHGAGVFVTALEPTGLLAGLAPVMGLIADRHDAAVTRLLAQIEGAAAARAAARGDAAGLAGLEQALSELRMALGEPVPRGSGQEFNKMIARLSEDRFHRAVARLADDPVAEGMIAVLRGAREEHALEAVEVEAHQRLVEAIRRGEPDEARTLASALALAEHPPVGEAAPDRAPTASRLALRGPATTGEAAQAEPFAHPAWFRDAKLGLLVHWGVYTIPGWAPLPDPAVGHRADEVPVHYFAEWYQASAAAPGTPTARHHQQVYGGRPYASFRPAFESAVATWSPDGWADLFAASGARYVVMVAKHHDGYALWPSRVRHPREEGWRSARDVVGELADAVRARGLRYGVFYSSGADWSFGALPPGRPADAATTRPTGSEYARYVEAHWRELITTYRPDGVWNDTGYPAEGDARRMLELYRAEVPDGVVADRFRTSGPGGSVRPERVPGEPWESVRPLGVSFGWNRAETAEWVMSGAELVQLLLEVVAGDGNLLLGVAPDDRGRLPAAQEAALRYLGTWLAEHGDAVFGSRPWGPGEVSTRQGERVWSVVREGVVHLFVEGASPEVEVPGRWLAGCSAQLLDGTPIAVAGSGDGVVLSGLPAGSEESPVRHLIVRTPESND
ncbi:hypothetical protein GCM10022215_15880 [Nocardioides fonticola]|uniref:alpha-L-fucosidase n=1 Tax=Nocardioides fonticola TaxID=450363 RepID=A0ABP7XH32_9ACTN